ncbi:MAG: hypothetical protein EOO04_12785 [Chitinophagaceae bacterium]|nr:MAG: hypothetical protein EOO04_12785 [Chitinophagaceae bacterium]
MLNPRTKDAVEILNGLVRINNRRIQFYQDLLRAPGLPGEYRELFAVLVGESYQNTIWIGIEIQTIEGSIDSPTPVNNIIPATAEKAICPPAANLLADCSAIETTIREAYSSALTSVYIPQYMRDLLKKQVRRLESAKRHIERLSS